MRLLHAKPDTELPHEEEVGGPFDESFGVCFETKSCTQCVSNDGKIAVVAILRPSSLPGLLSRRARLG